MQVEALHQSSAGHVLSSSLWLDAHFASCRAEYEALLDAAAPLTPGMSVLDAGCGSGSYLPSIRERIGGRGYLIGLDLSGANVLHAFESAAGKNDGAVAGSVTALPFRDRSFDGVWCANTVQYFADRELPALFSEFQRILRPGGIVAIKDVDMTGFRISPAPAFLGLHLGEAAVTGPDVAPQSHGSLRGRELKRWVEDAGLLDVTQTSVLIERWGPLEGADLQFWSEWLPYLAAVAEARSVPPEDLEVWRSVATPSLARAFVQRPDFYGCELQVAASGRVA
jgi:SAM-dependent methyltransferase